MADEQTPQSDLIDDAIRQAERQLEQKLEALRMSALGELTPATTPPADDVAVLRPTGVASDARTSVPRDDDEVDVPSAVPVEWQEMTGDDLTFAPADDATTGDDVTTGTLTDAVSGLTAVWDDEDESPFDAPAKLASTPEPTTEPTFEPTVEPTVEPPIQAAPTSAPAPHDWDHPEPVHASWTGTDVGVDRAARDENPPRVRSVPSEDEMQFWAHTRTALRNLQQATDGIAGEVGGQVTGDVERIVRDEFAPSADTLRQVQQQLQQGLPKLADRLEASLEQALTTPVNGIRQVHDELPVQLDRVAREQRESRREDLDHTAASVHGAVQQDIAHLEQSIATNVTRMAQGTSESIARVERDVDVLGETLVRFERGVHSEFDRVEAQLRASIEHVESKITGQLVAPSEAIRKLDQELPARFDRVEQSLAEQIQGTQRDLTTVLTSLVDVNRASLDRIAALASTVDEDRARRTEDVEVIVDTITTGWEGLAGAIKALFEQQHETSRRIIGIEQRLTQLRDVEGAMESTMDDFRRQISDLQPAPVIVTVAHPEAEVRNSARGGWLPERRD